MIITIIPSVYCVPGTVLSALPMLLYLIRLTVECNFHGANESKSSIVFVLKRGGHMFSSPLNRQN